jgi:hypothetical protein
MSPAHEGKVTSGVFEDFEYLGSELEGIRENRLGGESINASDCTGVKALVVCQCQVLVD